MAANKSVLPTTDPSWFRIAIRANVGIMADAGFTDLATVWGRVQDIFTVYCKASGGRFAGGAAYWCDSPLDANQVKPWEVVVYLLPSASKTLLKGRFSMVNFEKTKTGHTAMNGSKTLSEVYLDHAYHASPELLANTIVHELMHNKLNMGDELHALTPFVGDIGGFAQENLPSNSKLATSSADRSNMGPALSKVVAQYDNL
jgi:hypothetical protein